MSPTPIPVDMVFMVATSSGMANDINELRLQIDKLNSQMRAANLDAWYGLVTFPGGNPNDAPRQVQNLSDFATFTAARQPVFDVRHRGLHRVRQPGCLGSVERPGSLDQLQLPAQLQRGRRLPLTDEDDDSPAIDVTAALSALTDPRQPAKFFGITQDPNSTLSGNTAQTYGEFARQSGGALFDINDFRQNPSIVFNTFSQAIVSSLAGGLGVGITVADNAAPTVLNNILAGLATGISRR